MKKFANKELCEIFATSVNYVLRNTCAVSVEDNPNNAAQYRIIFDGFPVYPQNDGVVVFCVPRNMLTVHEHDDILFKSFPQNSCALFGGSTKNTTTALLHCNVFDDGRPSWGRAINDTVDELACWLIMTMLRNNITKSSMLCMSTRRMGLNEKEISAKQKQIQNQLIKVLGTETVNIDSVTACKAFCQKFYQLLQEE